VRQAVGSCALGITIIITVTKPGQRCSSNPAASCLRSCYMATNMPWADWQQQQCYGPCTGLTAAWATWDHSAWRA